MRINRVAEETPAIVCPRPPGATVAGLIGDERLSRRPWTRPEKFAHTGRHGRRPGFPDRSKQLIPAMSDLAHLADAPPPDDADTYDLVPYASYSYPQTHPRWLGVMGSLFGLDPPDPARARVLELGCASGGNLIPIAALTPETTCLGVEMSQRQVDAGRADIAALGLGNVRLERMSIAEVTPDLGTFDYIICHGVFSWVPAETRKHILRVAKENLAPQGIAYVSYNTLPGWNAVRSLRDMMLYHSAQFADPAQRVKEAVTMLQFVLNGLGTEDSAWRKTVETELNLLKSRGHEYIFHDHLETENTPVYLHEFMAMATERGLRYFGDSALATMYLGNLPAQVSGPLGQVRDIVRREQYMDFVRNRRFRQTLLVHAARTPKFDVDPGRVCDFHLTSANLAPDFDAATDPMTDDRPRSFGKGVASANNRYAAALFVVLHEQGNFPIAAARLIARAAERLRIADTAPVRAALVNVGLRMIYAGRLRLHAGPYPGVAEISERPRVWDYARRQAASRATVTTQRHDTTTIPDVARELAQLLDGTRTVPEAAAGLWLRVKDRGLQLNDAEGKPLTEETAARKELEQRTTMLVRWFRDQALLAA